MSWRASEKPELATFFSWRHAVLKSDLAPTTKHVLLTLSCHMNAMGEGAFPSTKLLAEETGYSERCVVTHLASSKKKGWIKAKVHGFGGRGWKRHEYCLAWPNGTEVRSAPKDESLKDVQHENGEALNVERDGTEPRSGEALNDVQCSTSSNSPKNLKVSGNSGLARTDEAKANWKKISGDLKASMNLRSWETWVRPLSGAGIDGKTLVVWVPTREFSAWIGENYAEKILLAAKKLGLAGSGLRFVVRGSRSEGGGGPGV